MLRTRLQVGRRAVLALGVMCAGLFGGRSAWGWVSAQERAPASAQAEVPADRPLAVQEAMVREHIQRFRERMLRLREELAAVEPENARRLDRAIEALGSAGVTENLDAVIELLSRDATLNEALDLQGRCLSDLDGVLKILTQRDGENEARKEQIDQLEAQKRAIEALLGRQTAVRDKTGQAVERQRLAERVQQAIEQVETSLREQAALTEQTQQAAQSSQGQAAQDRTERARQQQELADRMKALGAELERLGESVPPGDDVGGGSSPEADALREARTATREAGSQTQSGAGKLSEAAEDVERAQDQKAAEKQQSAQEDLRRALHELRAAEEALRKDGLGSEDLGSQQRDVAREAQRALDQMRSPDGQAPSDGQAPKEGQSPRDGQAPKEGQSPRDGQRGSQRGQPGDPQTPPSSGGSPQTPSPAQDDLERAQREMDDAADKLERSEEEGATENQDRAIEALKNARQELDDALRQERKEQREEILRDLEGRFHDMFARQRVILEETVRLDAVGVETFGRAEKLKVVELADGERQLSQDAGTCLHILEEEGTTIVFPRVLSQLGEDMAEVATRLGESRIGALTQTMESEILETLEQLLDAVQQMQQQNAEQQQSPPGSDDVNAPLLPTSAELKLLRAAQQRVNERTSTIESAREDEAESPESLRRAIQGAADRQSDCARIADEMRERLKRP